MILVTGGSGFFGGLLKARLLEEGHEIINVDLCQDDLSHQNLHFLQGDVSDEKFMHEKVFGAHAISAVFHCAAILAHDVSDEGFLWRSNVEGTRVLAKLAADHSVRHFVFISSNCLWASGFDYPVTEDEPPNPVEIYGRSKLEGERILEGFRSRMNVVVFRSPTIVEMGRLGLLAILFEFIAEGRKTWVVGGGGNRYQFIYAMDLVAACLLAIRHEVSGLFNIGSDNVKTFREVYEHVIRHSGSGARVASLPRGPALFAMRLAHTLRVSPLGPYQYKMIAEDFVFDTSRIKRVLGWQPTLTNEDMLLRAYDYYFSRRHEIATRQGVSAHKRGAKLGVIRLLKWLS